MLLWRSTLPANNQKLQTYLVSFPDQLCFLKQMKTLDCYKGGKQKRKPKNVLLCSDKRRPGNLEDLRSAGNVSYNVQIAK